MGHGGRLRRRGKDFGEHLPVPRQHLRVVLAEKMRRPADQHPLLVLKVKVEAQVPQVLDACDRLDELVLAALCGFEPGLERRLLRSEEHTSELQSLMRISYAVFCLKKKNTLHYRIQTNY